MDHRKISIAMKTYIKYMAGLTLTPMVVTKRIVSDKGVEPIITIGYGHVVCEVGDKNSDLDGMQWAIKKAEEEFEQDIFAYEQCVCKLFEGVKISNEQFDALVSYTFDQGIKNKSLTGFHQVFWNPESISDLSDNLVIATKNNPYRKDRTKIESSLLRKESHLVYGPTTTVNQGAVAVQGLLNKLYSPLLTGLSQFSGKAIVKDGITGMKTKSALTVALQLYLNELGAGIPVDGIVTDAIASFMSNNNICVKYGDSNELSRLVQLILMANGYNVMKEEDISREPRVLGTKWINYLKDYQDKHHLIADGIAGPVFFHWALQ